MGNIKIPQKLLEKDDLNYFQSIECQIMDWADDTAYAINDIVDGTSVGFINIVKLSNWQKQNVLNEKQNLITEELIEWIKNENYKRKLGKQIGVFISACKLKVRKTFMDSFTNRYKFVLEIPDEIYQKAKLYKNTSVDLVFRTSSLHQIEFKGNSMTEKIFKLLYENYIVNKNPSKLLSDFNDKLIRSEKNKSKKARLICDYISGATDSYAMRIYKRLFDPDYSSLADLA